MKEFWQRILNIFHPKAAKPIENWQKEVFEELDSLSVFDEAYWDVIQLLEDKQGAEAYFVKKNPSKRLGSSPFVIGVTCEELADLFQSSLESCESTPKKARTESKMSVISDNYKRPLHRNPHYNKW